MVKTHQPIQHDKHPIDVKKPKKLKLNISKKKDSSLVKHKKQKPTSSLPIRHIRVKNINISKAVIKRLGRRAGVKRSTGQVSDYIRKCIRVYMELVLRSAMIYTTHDHKRKTIEERDITASVKDTTGTRYLGRYTQKKSRHITSSKETTEQEQPMEN